MKRESIYHSTEDSDKEHNWYSQLSTKWTPSGIGKSVHWWSCPLKRIIPTREHQRRKGWMFIINYKHPVFFPDHRFNGHVMGDKFSLAIKLLMDTANESQKEYNFIPRRPFSPKGFENTFPNYLVNIAQCFLLRWEIQWLFVHFTQRFFRTSNTRVVCAFDAVFLERVILLLFVHFTWRF